MVRSQEQKTRDREKRYRKNYNIDLATYNAIGEKQGWRCGACGRHQSEFTVSLNVDHEHFKITLVRENRVGFKGWLATTLVRGVRLVYWDRTQKKAKAGLSLIALPRSIRGLLCPGRYTGCNRLMGRVDRPDWLKKVIHYLENPPAHQIIS